MICTPPTAEDGGGAHAGDWDEMDWAEMGSETDRPEAAFDFGYGDSDAEDNASYIHSTFEARRVAEDKVQAARAALEIAEAEARAAREANEHAIGVL